MSDEIILEPREPGRRRRYTAEQKRRLLEEAERPGASVSEVARRYGVPPSIPPSGLVLPCRRLRDGMAFRRV